MTPVLDACVGREHELAELRRALSRARDGLGCAWFLVGQAGIGKTRTAEEVSRTAAELGFLPLFGRCWEAGGAPSYWPWVSVLRTLFRGRDPATQARWVAGRGALLGQILPEFAAAATPGTLGLDAQAARFQLMDAVASCLADAAADVPLLIVLEDLHAADPSSVTLLDFVTRQANACRYVVLGTYRPWATEAPGIGETLGRVSQRSTTVELPPLARSSVKELVLGLLREDPSETVLDALQSATDGNPLFIVEMCRWSKTRGGLSHLRDAAIPPNLRRAIRERLATLPSETLARLELAAVLGREFRLQLLSEAQPAGDPRVELIPALDAAILIETLPGQCRFAHGLIREAIYGDLPLANRETLHRQVAAALAPLATHQPELHASEFAHHLLLGGAPAREGAVSATQRAAEHAARHLGFYEARTLYERALEALDSLQGEAPLAIPDERRWRCELLLGLGNAAIHGGGGDGPAACLAAAAIARELESPELLAEAALEYGAEFSFGVVDGKLVELLEEASTRLPDTSSGLRARVLARLAAALQPASDPRGPIEMALQAVAMARASAAPIDLLRTLRSAGSALMDLAPPALRIGVNREHAQLALALGDAVEELRAEMRLAFDYFELGDLTSAAECIERSRERAETLGLDRFRWRACALAAMLAAWRGDFAKANELRARANEFSARAGDANGPRCLAIQNMGFARLRGAGDFQQLLTDLNVNRANVGLMSAAGDLLCASTAVNLGRALPFDAERCQRAAALTHGSGDFWLMDMIASVAGNVSREVLEHLYTVMLPEADRFASGGLAAMVWERPAGRALGVIAHALGRHTEADGFFARAIAQLDAAGSPPHAAWTRYEWAARRLERGLHDARSEQLLTAALTTARALDMPALVSAIEALPGLEEAHVASANSNAQAPVSVTARFALEPDGENWRVSRAGQQWQLRDSKGVRWLWRLVNEPGREFHVLDLASSDPVDGGDSGPVLDEKSRQAYRERLLALQSEAQEAAAYNDPGRAERTRTEIDALSQQLAEAFGLAGRERRSGSALERARVNVQRRLKDAVGRIGRHDPSLGRHLERCLRTGTYCSYQPE